MNSEERDLWIERFVEECGEEGDPAQFLARHPEAPDGLAAALANVVQLAGRFPATNRPPSTLGGWRIGDEIGRGGVARVYRADHPGRPGIAGALKRLDPLLAVDPRARQRFLREAAILRKLDHPRLARVLDADESADVPWLVLELCEGGSLAAWLAANRGRQLPERASEPGGGTTPEAIAAFVAEIAAAVAALHEHGVLHRDLKPANILLDRDGGPIVIDFGLAARIDQSTLSRTGDLLGTLPYMAPEQARGERALPATDVWGIGAILHELLTGEPPRRSQDAAALVEEARTRPIDRVAVERGGTWEPLAAIAERALAFRPARRFASAALLAETLQQLAAGKPSRVDRPSAFERTADRLLVRRRVVALLLATAAAAGGVAWQLGSRKHPEPVSRSGADAGEEAAARADFARRYVAALGNELALAANPRAEPAETLADTEHFFAGQLGDGEARRRAGDLGGAITVLRGAVAERPDDPLAQAVLTVAVLQSGDRDAARHELEIAWRLLPGTKEFARLLAPLIEAEGRAQFDAGDITGAAERFEQLVALDPLRDEAWRQLAVARARIGDGAGTLAAAERALDFPLSPAEREAALRIYAIALSAEGTRDLAIEILEGVVERAPDYLQARLTLGLILDQECDLFAAREQYEAALELDPVRVETLGTLIHLLSGSNRAECERCRAAFAAHPELDAPDQVEALAIRYLRASGGHDQALLHVVRRTKSVGRAEALRPVLDELHAAATDDATLGALTRARRLLDGT